MDSQKELLIKGIKGNKCYIDTPLEGEINIASLANKNLEEIHFSEGEISRVINVPKGIKRIAINKNALEELPVQRDLVYLEANHNNLTRVNLNGMDNLATLIVKNNQIQKIENLPESLQTLHIDNNNLDELDLTHAPNCMNVSCINNPRLHQIIGGKQISSPDFILNKDAHTQIRIGGGSKKRNSPKEPVIYFDVKEAVGEYYALKNKYEEYKRDVVKNIMNKNGSRKEKIQMARNAGFKCINCGKEGGTLFSKDENHLKAICGNTKNPCNLNIMILSSLSLSDHDIRINQKEVDVAKQQIIQTKMNTLFGYTDDETAVKLFEKYLNIIKTNNLNDVSTTLNNSYYEMQNNSEKVGILNKKMENVHKELAEIRRIMAEYALSKNKKLLEDVAQKQKKIQDAFVVIRSIKYPIHEIVKETVYNIVDDDGNFIDESKAAKIEMDVLKQYPYSFDDFLNPNLEMLEVKKFNTN